MFKKIRNAFGRFVRKHPELAGALSVLSLLVASSCGYFFYGYLLTNVVSVENYYAVLAVFFGGAISTALFVGLSLLLFFFPSPQDKKN